MHGAHEGKKTRATCICYKSVAVDDEVLRVTMGVKFEERGASCIEGEIVDSRTSNHTMMMHSSPY